MKKQQVLALEMAADHPGVGPEFCDDLIIETAHVDPSPTSNTLSAVVPFATADGHGPSLSAP
jgi:hypothetical protein